VRTALASMICGPAVDRFGLVLDGSPAAAHVTPARGLLPDRVSAWTSIGLVRGIALTMATGLRFLARARAWQRQHEPPGHHDPYLAPFFALMEALFGIVLPAIRTTAMA